MQSVTFEGVECHLGGAMPKVGDFAPEFTLVGQDLREIGLCDFEGKRVVVSVFPSFDTGVCAMAVRRFNSEVAAVPNTVVICVSMDLPFAAVRFCATEGIDNVVTASAFRSVSFADSYGVRIIDGVLASLLARAVFIIDESGKISYTQLVDEITDEPDYKSVVDALCQ